MIGVEDFLKAAKIIKEAYETDEGFRNAVYMSALSAIKELRGSNSDEKVARVVVERLFGDD